MKQPGVCIGKQKVRNQQWNAACVYLCLLTLSMNAFSINSSPGTLVSFCGMSKVMFCHLWSKKVIVLLCLDNILNYSYNSWHADNLSFLTPKLRLPPGSPPMQKATSWVGTLTQVSTGGDGGPRLSRILVFLQECRPQKVLASYYTYLVGWLFFIFHSLCRW